MINWARNCVISVIKSKSRRKLQVNKTSPNVPDYYFVQNHKRRRKLTKKNKEKFTRNLAEGQWPEPQKPISSFLS